MESLCQPDQAGLVAHAPGHGRRVVVPKVMKLFPEGGSVFARPRGATPTSSHAWGPSWTGSLPARADAIGEIEAFLRPALKGQPA